ncbi:MAG: Gfo/Idh/MocA family oxidoreductase [Bryobacterales bacterium]|nr:Gfo/Idh/MocA family oxidoreductase [Bryobacterales bacterium]
MMTRRTLLAAAVAAPSSAANSAIAVGVLGTGNRGTYVGAMLAKHTPVRIVALCDLHEDRLAAATKAMGLERPRLYQDFEKMLASGIDAIVIATPVFLHAGHFEAAVKAGKHIYIEKPAAADVEGCKRIMRAADAADRKLNISFGFQRRYAQVYLKAKQLADSGAAGRIRLGSARFIKNDPAPPIAGGAGKRPRPRTEQEKVATWTEWRDLSGDLIVENNVHSIDVLNWFLGGRPLSAIGAGGVTAPGQGDVRDHNFVAFEYAGGVQGQLSGTTLAPRGYRDVVEQFFGETGFIETSENHWRHVIGSAAPVTEKAARPNTVDSVAAFVQRIQDGKPENTGVRGAESSLTAILGRLAMDRRREVTWDEMMQS